MIRRHGTTIAAAAVVAVSHPRIIAHFSLSAGSARSK